MLTEGNLVMFEQGVFSDSANDHLFQGTHSIYGNTIPTTSSTEKGLGMVASTFLMRDETSASLSTADMRTMKWRSRNCGSAFREGATPFSSPRGAISSRKTRRDF